MFCGFSWHDAEADGVDFRIYDVYAGWGVVSEGAVEFVLSILVFFFDVQHEVIEAFVELFGAGAVVLDGAVFAEGRLDFFFVDDDAVVGGHGGGN